MYGVNQTSEINKNSHKYNKSSLDNRDKVVELVAKCKGFLKKHQMIVGLLLALFGVVFISVAIASGLTTIGFIGIGFLLASCGCVVQLLLKYMAPK